MWFSKRQQGVISVFLLICFTMTFVFSGLLVDGARIRLARMLAEGSLDTAASSVLSYYDELLFDLYGLFAVEDPDMEKIKARMNQYFEQTLALVPGDHTELKNMLNDSVEQAFFDGYDFQAELTAVGSQFDLGQTMVTRAQIVEYMKYRAPLQLIDSEYGFLKNVQGLLEIKDRLVAVKDKNDITKKHKNSVKQGGELVKQINDFKDECEHLLKDPLDRNKSSFAATVNDAIDSYNESLRIEFTEYCRVLRAHQDAMESEDGISDSEEQMYKNKEAEIIANVGKAGNKFFKDTIYALQEKLGALYEQDKALKNSVDDYVNKMQSYINELQSKCDSGNQEYKTVFEPEIELCKATVGEVIVNKGVLLQAQLHLNITSSYENFYSYINGEVDKQFAEAENNWGRDLEWHNITGKINSHQYITDMLAKMNNLSDTCTDFTYVKEETQSPTYKPKNLQEIDDFTAEEKDSAAGNPMQKIDLSLADGAIDGDGAAKDEETFDLNEKYKEDADKAAADTLDKGINLLNELMGLLESARDEIYVDEYILANCRNYVHHYNMDKDKAGKTESNTTYESIIAGKFLTPEYQNKQYMVGEIEYILAGNDNQYLNVAFVSGEILLFRTAFNLAAIFTDSSMYQQASTICAAAGPFAPLATFALMVAWAVAESVIDVLDIMAGKKVLLFKKGKDWNISAQGAIKNLVGKVIDEAATVALNEGKYYFEQVSQKYNSAIYDYYAASGNLQFGLDEAQQTADDLGVGIYTEDLINVAKDGINNANDIVGNVNNQINNTKDKVITKISSSYNSVKENVSTQISNNFPAPELPYKSGIAEESSLKLGYTDYLRILLLMENSDKKMKRLQQVIQINMRQQDNHGDFTMVNSRVNVWGEATCSIKYLFMTDMLVPEEMRMNGRHQFKVKTNRTY